MNLASDHGQRTKTVPSCVAHAPGSNMAQSFAPPLTPSVTTADMLRWCSRTRANSIKQKYKSRFLGSSMLQSPAVGILPIIASAPKARVKVAWAGAATLPAVLSTGRAYHSDILNEWPTHAYDHNAVEKTKMPSVNSLYHVSRANSSCTKLCTSGLKNQVEIIGTHFSDLKVATRAFRHNSSW